VQSDISASRAPSLGRALLFRRAMAAGNCAQAHPRILQANPARLAAARAAPLPVFRRTTKPSDPHCIFHCSHCYSHCFSIDTHCSCAGGFSLVRPKPYIVIDALFPLQIACIYFWRPLRRNKLIDALRLIGAASRPKAQCRQGHRRYWEDNWVCSARIRKRLHLVRYCKSRSY